MLMNLKEIQDPINKEMDEFKKKLKTSISSENSIIDTIINYMLKRKGKQLRPIFVFLTACPSTATSLPWPWINPTFSSWAAKVIWVVKKNVASEPTHRNKVFNQ